MRGLDENSYARSSTTATLPPDGVAAGLLILFCPLTTWAASGFGDLVRTSTGISGSSLLLVGALTAMNQTMNSMMDIKPIRR